MFIMFNFYYIYHTYVYMEKLTKHHIIIIIIIISILALIWNFIRTIIYNNKELEWYVGRSFSLLKSIKNKFYYHPDRKEYFTRPNGDIEDVYIIDKDGHRLHGWYHNPHKPSSNKTVLFSHGNGGNLTTNSFIAASMMDENIPFLMFDYKGYGKSEGKTYLGSTYNDMLEWYNYLITDKKIEKFNIVPMGNSIGSFPASKLAVTHDLNKLIILAGFNSISEVVRDKISSPLNHILAYFTSGDLNVDKYLSQYLHDPLILHSKEDTMISFRNAELNVVYGGHLVELKGDHNSLHINWTIIKDYLNNNKLNY
jgi:uncharacterized protein